MVNNHNKLGIIAGGGQFPILLANELKSKGFSVIAVAHNGETEATFSQIPDKTIWIELGQLDQLIYHFKQNGVAKAIMAGTINKRRMFDNPIPDETAMRLISGLPVFHDDGILRALSDLLKNEGIEIISASVFLPELTAPAGYLTKRRPDTEEEQDVEFGWNMAKSIGRLDIGQCVVVRKKTILAVEAIEGTDNTIQRGGLLAKERAVVVKVCKPNQDLRFDMPSIGPQTIRVMSQVRAGVLAVEAGKTLIFDSAQMIELADKSGISIIALKKGD
jgi:DUF1009 family protein